MVKPNVFLLCWGCLSVLGTVAVASDTRSSSSEGVVSFPITQSAVGVKALDTAATAVPATDEALKMPATADNKTSSAAVVDPFPLVIPEPLPGDEFVREAQNAFRKRDLKRLEAVLPKLDDHVLHDYPTLWALELRLKADPENEEARKALTQFAQAHQGEYVGETAVVRFLRATAETLDGETYETFYKQLLWNQEEVDLRNWYLSHRLQEAALEGKIPSDLLSEAKRHLRDQRSLSKSYRALTDQLAQVDRGWTWDRVLIALQKKQWKEAKTLLRAVPRPLLPAPLATLERIIDKPLVWYRSVEKKLPSVPARLGVFASFRLISASPNRAEKLIAALEKKLAARWSALLWNRLAYDAAVDQKPEAKKWFSRAGKTLIDPELTVEFDGILMWQARNTMLEGNWYSLYDVMRRMPDRLLDREEWTYWTARALEARGHKKEAHALYEKLAPRWTFYGKLACDALHRPYPKAPTAQTPAEEDVIRWEKHPGIQRAEAFYRLHLYGEGHREWNWSMRGLQDDDRLSLAEYARRKGIVHRMINTSERVSMSRSDFRMRYPTPLLSVIQEAAQQQNLPYEWTLGLIRQESRFIPAANSSVGAQGLMQLMPQTASWMARKLGLTGYKSHKIGDIEMNLLLGTAYLRSLYDSLEENLPLATAAYNAGPVRARSWRANLRRPVESAVFIEAIPYFETRAYVKNVMANYHSYDMVWKGEAPNFTKFLGSVRPNPATKSKLP